jgi:hypothetical protein
MLDPELDEKKLFIAAGAVVTLLGISPPAGAAALIGLGAHQLYGWATRPPRADDESKQD